MPTKTRTDYRHTAMDKLLTLGKRLFVSHTPTPDKNSKHRASIFSRPVKFPKPRFVNALTKGKACPSQHDRVVMSRAARMGISVKEYEVKYPSAWKTEREYDEYLLGLLDAADVEFRQSVATDEAPF